MTETSRSAHQRAAITAALANVREIASQSDRVIARAGFKHAEDLISFAHGMGCDDPPLQVSEGRLSGILTRLHIGDIELAYETCNRDLIFENSCDDLAACIHGLPGGDRFELLGQPSLIALPAWSRSVYLGVNGNGPACDPPMDFQPVNEGDFWAAMNRIVETITLTADCPAREVEIVIDSADLMVVINRFATELTWFREEGESRRSRTLMRFLDLAQQRSSFRVSDLVEDLNMTRRNLHYYATKHLGIAPKKLVKSMALRNAMCALPAATASGKSIADVAFEHGFESSPQFSLDYRLLFGERPSDTRRRHDI